MGAIGTSLTLSYSPNSSSPCTNYGGSVKYCLPFAARQNSPDPTTDERTVFAEQPLHPSPLMEPPVVEAVDRMVYVILSA